MSPKRLVLFDIDGTILWGGGLWKEAFFAAMDHFFPNFNFPNVYFGGKTDLQIAREMLASTGASEAEIDDHMRRIVDHYIDRAIKLTETRAHEIKILPGVHEILTELSSRPEVVLGLLTGNVKKGAMAKLSCLGLNHFFKVGVFGDDHWDRYKLPTLAVERTKLELGHEFSGKQIVIIGDTIHDVNCGKSIGVRSIAVGTGRNIPTEDLLAQNPDYYFKDLSATVEVVAAILDEL